MLRRVYVSTLLIACCVSLVGCGGSSAPQSASAPKSYSERTDAASANEEMMIMDWMVTEGGSAPAAPMKTESPAQLVDESKVVMDPDLQDPADGIGPGMGGDKHSLIVENSFVPVRESPLSTFSIDVDTASYSKTRMHLLQHNSLPPADAVRIEELVNYFDYDYSPPVGEHPFSVHVEVADAPWKVGHRFARIGLKGRELQTQRPSSNLVFLLDVSGSMDYHNKLPLVKEGMGLLTSQLGENDRVSIVVYAGAAGLVLPPTLGDDRHRIMEALNQLHAGGSTNGGEGIQLAYHVARQNFIRGGVNRVILCTDGDFNVGDTGTGGLVRLAEQEAKQGIHLSVLGFGMGNHNDAMLEELSNRADGNYAFIDNANEARKVLLDQVNSTLVTIAKDVKIQIEFNPMHVAAYRLIGYENRHLEAHEFNDDRKDAGEIGAGHTVTALYEIIPVGESTGETVASVDPLKYQKREIASDASDELMTVKLRYKNPDEAKSKLIVAPVKNNPVRFGESSHDFQFASAVAAFGMLLRDSKNRGDATYASVLEIANASRGEDRHGYRGEFVELVAAAGRFAGEQVPAVSSLTPPAVRLASPSRPVATYHYPAAQPARASTWGNIIGATVIVASVIVSVCVIVLAIVFASQFLVLPNAVANEQHAWPCTEKQRNCVSRKPPVRI